MITFVPFSYTNLSSEPSVLFHIFFDIFGDFVLKGVHLLAGSFFSNRAVVFLPEVGIGGEGKLNLCISCINWLSSRNRSSLVRHSILIVLGL